MGKYLLALSLLFAVPANAITYTLTGTLTNGGNITGTLDTGGANNLWVNGFLFNTPSLDVYDEIGFQENRLTLTLDPIGNDFTAVYDVIQDLYPLTHTVIDIHSVGSGTYIQTPLPTAFPLFVIGFSLLLWWRRR